MSAGLFLPSEVDSSTNLLMWCNSLGERLARAVVVPPSCDARRSMALTVWHVTDEIALASVDDWSVVSASSPLDLRRLVSRRVP